MDSGRRNALQGAQMRKHVAAESTMKNLAAKLMAFVPWLKYRGLAQAGEELKGPSAVVEPASTSMPTVVGIEPSWLRMLTSDQLITVEHTECIYVHLIISRCEDRTRAALDMQHAL